MGCASGLAHEVDPANIQTLSLTMVPDPGDHASHILDHRRPLEFRRQPVGNVDPAESIPDRPDTDIVIEGTAGGIFISPHESTAVDKNQDWSGLFFSKLRLEHIQPVPFMITVFQVPVDDNPRKRRYRMQRGIEFPGCIQGVEVHLAADRSDLCCQFFAVHHGS